MFAEAEIARLFSSWTEPHWDELDWGRVKEMTTRDILERRSQEAAKAQQGHCFDCPNFVKHVRGVLFQAHEQLTNYL